jgi:4-hydroxythreonine-4-phosphate dehydrogenase
MNQPLIGITMGDPAGIGPEVIIKTFLLGGIRDFCQPLLLGDLGVIEEIMSLIGIVLPIEPLAQAYADSATLRDAAQHSLKKNRIPLIPLSNIPRDKIIFGVPRPAQMEAVLTYIRTACDYAQRGFIDAMVTAPVSKEMIIAAGVSFRGHTEMLAELTNTPRVVMLMAGEKINVSLVTTHYPISELPHIITKENVYETILATHRFFVKYFAKKTPKIAICGLNPHCGEGGRLGDEEQTDIIPAIMQAKSEGIAAEGPISADVVFKQTLSGQFDVVVCMYHDQGLIPAKLLNGSSCVNVTVGLPIIRTSPDHGVAYDIAGKNMASQASFISAMKLAAKFAQTRLKSFAEAKRR